MKKTTLAAVFLFFGMNAQAGPVSLAEGERLRICGRILDAGDIWVNEGTTQITFFIMEKENSKPRSGGYSWGEAVEVNDAHPGSCRYYVTEILKSQEAGKVTLSKNPPDPSSRVVCESSWELAGKAVNLRKKGDVVWANGCAYIVEEMENHPSRAKTARMKKLDHYLPVQPKGIVGTDAVRGEMINSPISK